ncbi:hypothetical protein LZ32DRAFT_405567 [Colletotrichum eremochloae]|nr:hypothetical protein LZ32DRAFT_405567 [Colletotrichum eremochloae]
MFLHSLFAFSDLSLSLSLSLRNPFLLDSSLQPASLTRLARGSHLSTLFTNVLGTVAGIARYRRNKGVSPIRPLYHTIFIYQGGGGYLPHLSARQDAIASFLPYA